MLESPFWSGRYTSRVLCERVAQADDGHELQGRQGHAFIPVRQDRNPTEVAGAVRGATDKYAAMLFPLV